jgi:hypothetical protein
MLSKATAITTLNSSGYTYGTNLFLCNIAPRNDVDVMYLHNTAFAYSNTIDVYTSFKKTRYRYSKSQDGIHRNQRASSRSQHHCNYFKDISVLNYKIL